MAEIHAKYDTKTKKLTVSKDGEEVNDVDSIQMYNNSYDGGGDNPEHSFHMSQIDRSTKDEGYHTRTHTVANLNGDVVRDHEEKVPAASLGNLIGKYLRRGNDN